MKKLLVLLMSVLLIGCLVACGETTPTKPQGTTTIPTTTQTPTTTQAPTTSHAHSYTETVTAPTCTEKGYTVYTCSCGDSYQGNDTAATGHNLVSYICQVCGLNLTPSEGLKYSLNSDGVSYAVSEIGECTNTEIVIASEYEGLPVTSIGDNAFNCCTTLTSITIPDSVISIGYGAFQKCDNLRSIEIPGSVTYIGSYAFYNCGSLASIDIQGSVAYIGSKTFYGCSSLTSISIPSSVTSIGSEAFSSCRNLTDIHFAGTMERWNAIEKANDWDRLIGDYTVYCTDGDIPKE